MNQENKFLSEQGIGIFYAVLAYIAWGFLPLYWKLLEEVLPLEILAHRIFWSFIFVSAIILASSGWTAIKNILTNKRYTCLLLLCSIIMGFNWFTYIWAVNANHVVEASMGYYINPLLTVFLAMIILKEKLNRWQGAAVVLALIGVIILTVQYGQIPWVAVILAVTFAVYSLIKKMVKVDPISGLALETALTMPVALAYILFMQVQGTGALGNVSWMVTIILMGAGIATATPLLWFAKATQRVDLTTIGLLQYLAPTISLYLGIFVFQEQFTLTHLISFGFIWVGLLIYSLSKIGLLKEKAGVANHQEGFTETN